MCKRLFCFLLIIIGALVPFSVLAADASAFLSDAATEQNRLFETTLSVNTKVASFVAILEFDPSKLEFKSAKALADDSELSVNSDDKGQVKLAFLNENGTKGGVIAFTFKAGCENAYISLNLEQVIGKNAEDIVLTNVKGSSITVNTKLADSKTNTNQTKNEKANVTEPPTATTTLSTKQSEDINLNVPPKEGSDLWLIAGISAGALLIVAVGITGFFLGRKLNDKK